ncbi:MULTISPECIES: molybdenum cofactor biosynthesis protein MoaE [unclassified Paenibacillus]|uniref:molybdenum cofactor biosynthesis protein MoaE n=1 Tax=unclassified Paenibacillus TaxID=185978 RepID=UPI0008386EAA|nr:MULTISPECIES: molybdenum cofactor biosynthesis protein MoaE [unclassified Paenibacillus]NWL88175.1 molybdenum cofactor biosynthesis protein MoaE [Paenibacillus sp. 79R4]
MNSSMYVITDQPIVPEEVSNKVKRREAGAITLFLGTVREWTYGQRTIFLEYEAYLTMALAQMEQIGHEVRERWADTVVAVTHRVGRLEISDIAVVIAVSSPHRKAAYEANEYVIERIKQMVPIWKKEHGEDDAEWIGDQLNRQVYPDGRPLLAEMRKEDQKELRKGVSNNEHSPLNR